MSDPADYTDMSARPRVSVIVTAYNLARYLPEALDSALAQESPGGPVQIIVVDDGSTDNTPDVLAAYADRVEVIRQENGGLVKAVDTGLGAVRGEYIALLDADDIWPLDRLRRHAELLDANPHVGLVHGDMEVIDADGATTAPLLLHLEAGHPEQRPRPRPAGQGQLRLRRRQHVPRVADARDLADPRRRRLSGLVDRHEHRRGLGDRLRPGVSQPVPLPRSQHGPGRGPDRRSGDRAPRAALSDGG